MRGVVLGLCSCWLAACGRVGFDPSGEDGGTGSEGAPVAPRCDPAKPYEVLTSLDKISTGFNEIGVKLTDDTLSGLVWTMSAPDRIYETTRGSTSSEFSGLRLLTELMEVASPPASDRDTGISGDGLTITFSSERPGGGGAGWDLWMATRPSRAAIFDPPKPITELNTGKNNWGGTLSSSGLAIYYVEEEDLTVARRRSTSEPFVVDTTGTLTALNAGGPDFEVVVSADERTIFFSAIRSTTGFDIWYSQRASTAVPFPPAKPLQELTQAGDEWAGWVSPDLCELYFARSNGGTGWDLYVATRPL